MIADCVGCAGAGRVERMAGYWTDPEYHEATCPQCGGSGMSEAREAPLGKCAGCQLVASLVAVCGGKPVCEDCASLELGKEPETARTDVVKARIAERKAAS